MLKIDPFDTLFFRDGKPFTMGADTAAEGIFPPYPSTLRGAIRGALIAQTQGLPALQAGTLKEEVGERYMLKDGTEGAEYISSGSVEMKGVFLWRKQHFWFPAPLDIVRRKKKADIEGNGHETQKCSQERWEFSLLRLHDDLFFVSNQPHSSSSFLMAKGDDWEEAQNSFISARNFNKYLHGVSSRYMLFSSSRFYQFESKIGIKKDRVSGASEDRHLYHFETCRLKKGVALACDVRGASSLAASGVLKLGGEGRVVAYATLDRHLPDDLGCRDAIIQRMRETKRFKLYFATPAIFNGAPNGQNAWQPDVTFLPAGVTFLTAAIGKPLAIGGWDVHRKQPKPMRQAIPAGSVYYYRIDAGDPAAIYDQLNYRNLSAPLYDIAGQYDGFGLTFVGAV